MNATTVQGHQTLHKEIKTEMVWEMSATTVQEFQIPVRSILTEIWLEMLVTAILIGTGMVFRIMLIIVQIFPTVTRRTLIMTDWVGKSHSCGVNI